MQREKGRGGRRGGRGKTATSPNPVQTDEPVKKIEIKKKIEEKKEDKDGEISEDDIPKHFLCPITHQIMLCPVIAANGQTYENDAISEWLACHNTDPISGVDLPNKNLIINRSTKNIISEFLENYPTLWENDCVYFSEPKSKELSEHIRVGNIRDMDRLLDEDRRFLHKKLIGTKNLVDILLEQGTLDCLKVYLKKKPKLPTHNVEKIEMLKRVHTKFSTVGTKIFFDNLSISEENLQEILFTAVDTNDTVLLDLTLQLGANVNKSTKEKNSILSLSLERNFDIFQVISSHPDIIFPTDLVEQCILKDKLQQFQFLITCPNKSKLSLNHLTSSSITLLSFTIAEGKFDFFQYLLSESLSDHLNINQKNKDGGSALITAIRTRIKQPAYIHELLKHSDVAVDVTDDDGNTALHYAVLHHDNNNNNISHELALQLVDRGANVKSKNLGQNTPIDLAKLNERWGLAKQLREHYKRFVLKSVLDPFQQKVDFLTAKVRQLEEALVERDVPLQQQVDVLTAKVRQLEEALNIKNHSERKNDVKIPIVPLEEEVEEDVFDFDLFG